jgi:hypothetical protein
LELIRHWGNLFDDPEGSIAFRIKFGGLMGELQVFPFEPNLIANVILAGNGFTSFCRFIDGPGGLISIFYQFSDAFFCHHIV